MSANIWAPGGEILQLNVENTNISQVFTASDGQTLFTLTAFSYVPATGSIAVYRNGQKLILGVDFTETSETSITLTGITLAVGETIEVQAFLGSTTAGAQAAADSATSANSAALAAQASASDAAAAADEAAASASLISNGPVFSASANAWAGLVSASTVIVVFGTEDFDNPNCYDPSTGRFTPTTAGYYQINFSMSISGSTISRFFGSIAKNGATWLRGQDSPVLSSSEATSIGSALVYLNGTTDYIYVSAYAVAGTASLSGRFSASLVRLA